MNVIILIISLLFSGCIFSQGYLNEQWFITLEGPQQLTDMAWGVALDEDENIYWAATQSVSGLDVKDVRTFKLDPNGNEIWSFDYGGLYEQQAYIAAYKDGIVYVGGRNFHDYSFPPFVNGSDAFVIAIDSTTHDTLWTWVWDGGYSYEEVDGLVIADDGIYVSGWTEDSTTLMNSFYAKLDFNGNQQYLYYHGTPLYDTQDGHMIVDDSTIYFSGMNGANSFGLNGEAHLAAFNRSTGAFKWSVSWGGSGSAHFDGLGLASDGEFLYQCGITNFFGDSTVFVRKIDKNGSIIWTYKTDKAIKGRSMTFDAEGYLYFAGTTTSLGAGGEDIILIAIDPASGTELAYETWGGVDDESVHDVTYMNGYFYLTGRTISYSSNGYSDALLIKTPFQTAFESVPEQIANPIMVYPNPAVNEVIIQNLPDNTTLIQIFSLDGRLVYSHNNPQSNHTISVLNWEAGTYLIKAQTDQGIISEKLVVQ